MNRPRAARSFLTHRPVAVSMVFLAAVVFGLLSYQGLAVTLMPELSYPTLTVRTEYPGAAPEEVENDISRRIEEQLGVVGGLRRMSSVSRAGVSDVVLEFSWDTPMSDAVQETLEKLDLVLLPDAAERPLILRFDPGLDPSWSFRSRVRASASRAKGDCGGCAAWRNSRSSERSTDRRRGRGAGAGRSRGGDPRAAGCPGSAAVAAVGAAGDRPPGPGEHQRRRRHPEGGAHRSTWCAP